MIRKNTGGDITNEEFEEVLPALLKMFYYLELINASLLLT